MISPSLLKTLVAAEFAPRYYALCAAHPYRAGVRVPCPHKEILATLNDLGVVSKEPGPGRMYRVRAPGQPDAVGFSFVIQGGVNIDPGLSLAEPGGSTGDNYAVLAHAANAHAGHAPASPPYPRPFFSSLHELRQVVEGSLELARIVGTIAAQ